VIIDNIIDERAFVSVIVPVRNEERYIRECVSSLVKQTYPTENYEIIVVDGRSSDKSREIVDELSRESRHLYCIDNPAGTAPAAMNIGIRHAKGDVIIRTDGHNFYPEDYIENCVKYLAKTGADNVGGPWMTVPADNSLGARLVAAMLSNPFGVGDSRFRISPEEGFVETVPFGAFRREVFDRVGMYNEKLVRNQDNDLNARIRSAGGKIYQTPALQTTYHPVAGFLQLLKQTYRNSQWHIFSVRENAKSMGLRHFAPALFVVMCAALIGGSPVSLVSAILLASLLSGYLLTGWYFAFSKSKSYGLGLRFLLPFACLCFHVSYGLGTLAGCRYLLTPPSAKPIRAGKEVSQDQTA
jgi:glycosyltransferase involved in cell wall biosynthesis